MFHSTLLYPTDATKQNEWFWLRLSIRMLPIVLVRWYTMRQQATLQWHLVLSHQLQRSLSSATLQENTDMSCLLLIPHQYGPVSRHCITCNSRTAMLSSAVTFKDYTTSHSAVSQHQIVSYCDLPVVSLHRLVQYSRHCSDNLENHYSEHCSTSYNWSRSRMQKIKYGQFIRHWLINITKCKICEFVRACVRACVVFLCSKMKNIFIKTQLGCEDLVQSYEI
jgi:hypothetical protein